MSQHAKPITTPAAGAELVPAGVGINARKKITRRRIEQFLQAADADDAFTPEAIAGATGISIGNVRKVINGLTRNCRVDNIAESGEGLYRWRWPVAHVAASRPRWELGGEASPDYWRRLQAAPARPGAMAAFELPSVEGGQVRERRVPLLLGSSVESFRR